MRVLITESDPDAATDAVQVLEGAGHQVVRCTEPGAAAFPCHGVAEGGCPLDEPVDVAVAVRAHPHPRPTSYEVGVTCALRQHVPVVVLGDDALDPLAPWALETTTLDTVLSSIDRASRTLLPRHAAKVTRDIRLRLGDGAEGSHAVVHREGRRTQVTLVLPPQVDDSQAEALAVRAAGAIREMDRWAGVIDVSVARGPEEVVP